MNWLKKYKEIIIIREKLWCCKKVLLYKKIDDYKE